MEEALISAYERWTWGECQAQILSLTHRLGYEDCLWVLGFELLEDGRLFDPFHGFEVFDPATAGPVKTIPSRYSAVPEMYCILSTYAATDAVPLSGEALALTELDRLQRPRLAAADCTTLWHYADRDWETLQAAAVPFFGAQREHGDFSFEVYPLPNVPISLVLWRGDEEMPDSGTLLFDRSAPHYLSNLLMELAWLTVWRLKNILDPAVKWGYHAQASL